MSTFVLKNLRWLFDKYAVAHTEHDDLVKSTTKIFSNFVAFSENPNFMKTRSLCRHCLQKYLWNHFLLSTRRNWTKMFGYSKKVTKNCKNLILCFDVTNFMVFSQYLNFIGHLKGHRNANASSENISPKCALCKGTLGFCCLAERRRPCSCSHAQKQKLTCFISTTYPYLMHPDMLSFGRLKQNLKWRFWFKSVNFCLAAGNICPVSTVEQIFCQKKVKISLTRQIHIFFNYAKTSRSIFCWFTCFYLLST